MSQIFEFHFNPPKQNRIIAGKDDLIFDSFCFEPKNIYEKKVGSLYMVGLLKNVLPPNIRFLDALAQKIKEKYYKTISSAPEKSLRDALKIVNEHLEKIAKAGDVSWLGNLSFTVISLKDFELNFTKVGDLKIFLIRKGQLIDIDRQLKFDEIEPYPLKIFGSIVSVRLAENDIFLVLSKEVYDAFLKENLLVEEDSFFSILAEASVNEFAKKSIKKFKDVLNDKKEQLIKISGICLLMLLSKETAIKEKEMISEKGVLKIFSLNPFFKAIKKIKTPKISLPKIPQIRFPKIKIVFPLVSFNKKIALILVLIAFLALGFFIFEKKEEKKIKTYQIQINQIEEKINQAESYLILAEHNPQAKKNANILSKEAWDEITPLLNISSSLADRVLELKNVISENLEQLNKLVKISEPELIFEFKPREFIPQKMIFFNNEIYFFTPYSENILKLNQIDKEELLQINKKFNMAAPLSNSLIFFSKPNQIIILKENQFSQIINLEQPSSDFDFNGLSSYRSHLYFLDNENKTIVKYPFLQDLNWGTPESWLSPTIKNTTDFKSMAVDGSIWILTKKNAIERYHSGRLQETINLEIFPEPKAFSKIFTTLQLPYLYILEPEQRRIIILDKLGSINSPQAGQIIKQYQSEKFDNLLDFSVSEDGKTIWLLNGLKIYKIKIDIQ